MTLRILLPTICLLYAVLRYNLFGDVSWSQTPLFVLNKAVALCAAISLATAALYGRQGLDGRRYWGGLAFRCAALHVLMSLILLPSGLFAVLVADQGFTARGTIVLLGGVCCAYCFSYMAVKPMVRYLNGLYLFLALHLLFLGLPGWLNPADWHGYLPPISMLCLLLCIFAFGWQRKK
jgi:hypothetical protein